MSRLDDEDLAAEVLKPEVCDVLLFEMTTADGPVYAWTGYGTLVWNGKEFLGTGIFGGVKHGGEKTDGSAPGDVATLSGIPDELVLASLASLRHHDTASVWFACLDRYGRLVGTPKKIVGGFVDVPELIDEAESSAISVSIERRSLEQHRPRVRRYTAEDQKIDDPTDEGFAYVEGLQDARIKWGSR